jgi:putative ABC transport system ATP-binding protein
MSVPAAIQLENISKFYQKGSSQVTVHQQFNLSVAQGEFVAIMGPSGLGKSTLLHLMGGLDRPSSGEIIVNNCNLSKLSERQLTRWRAENIGFVFQAHHLLPVLTAQANVELPLMLTHLNAKQRQQHANTALSLVNMQQRAEHLPKQLSGGQEQRVAIARAIVSDPNILLCDEPTGNLDRRSADDILALLTQLNQTFGKTIVMVTHDVKAADYATRVINLEQYIQQSASQLTITPPLPVANVVISAPSMEQIP